MARVRSLLIDATTGKIFTGSDRTTTSNSINLIAGATQRVISVAQGTGAEVVKNALNVGNGVRFGSNTTIVSITTSVTTTPTSLTTVTVKKGTVWAASANTIVATITLPVGSSSNTIPCAITISGTEKLFFDIAVGTTPPTGFFISYNYYSGY
jgi:hypothetical protein